MWEEMIPIEEWSNADFDMRTTSLTIWDKDSTVYPYRLALKREWSLNGSAATDRALRLLLWRYLDETGQNDLREKHDIVIAIPPSDFDWDSLDLEMDFSESGETQLKSSTLPNVYSLLYEIIEQEPYGAISKGAFAGIAVKWAATGRGLSQKSSESSESKKEKILNNPRPLTMLFRYEVPRKVIEWAVKRFYNFQTENKDARRGNPEGLILTDVVEEVETTRQGFNEYNEVFEMFRIFVGDPNTSVNDFAPNSETMIPFIDTNDSIAEVTRDETWDIFELLSSEIRVVIVQWLMDERDIKEIQNEYQREEILNTLGLPLQTWLRHEEELLDLQLFKKIGESRGSKQRYTTNTEMIDRLIQLDNFLRAVFIHGFEES